MNFEKKNVVSTELVEKNQNIVPSNKEVKDQNAISKPQDKESSIVISSIIDLNVQKIMIFISKKGDRKVSRGKKPVGTEHDKEMNKIDSSLSKKIEVEKIRKKNRLLRQKMIAIYLFCLQIIQQ